MDTFAQSRKAIKEAVDVIKREPKINTEDESGLKPDAVAGHIIFSSITFSYPTRPDTRVCANLSLELKPGTTLALAGPSGCGKSTVVQLMQRFYDPTEGRILLDGHDLRDLNVKWLRQNIAIVSQEPKLFSGTIAENIGLGASSAGREATREEIEAAARQANAHDFIVDFKDGYDTDVGFGGSQLSGGQKQRIAIARALVKKPKILLLDEATSALDNKSEQVVQEALDRLLESGENRTTIVIAHRLSTIRTADIICYVHQGEVIERGSHSELMGMDGGHYRALVEEQEIMMEKGDHQQSDAHTSRTSADYGSARPSQEGWASDRSAAKQEAEVDEEANDAEGQEMKMPWKRILAMNRPDLGFLLIGLGLGAVAGAQYPIWGWVFSEMLVIFYQPVVKCEDVASGPGALIPALIPPQLGGPFQTCQDYWDHAAQEIWNQSKVISYLWVVLTVVAVGASTGMFYGFGAASESLAYRVRNLMFATYLRQEPGYFDMPENAVGSVSSRLANDATLLKAKTGEPLQQIVITVFGLVLGVILAFVFAWPVALIAIGILPLMGFAMHIQVRLTFFSFLVRFGF